MKNKRLRYLAAFFIILAVEIIIALFIRDRFIRPYGGDILVTVLLCCFVRVIFPKDNHPAVRLLPLWVFLFAAAVEVGQYFDYVSLLGLGDIAFFRILLGTSFSWADLLCYGIGCAAFWVGEKVASRTKNKAVR
ncbi:MAG: DUF2809 domain-containing protein [Ruminococcaceae bacterium]|nr:DUF2809 domain-containing protein [Oscillospiraceae bacterium]